MDKRILLFGTKNCKFCKLQKKILRKSFNNKNWLYIDIEDDDGALEIAKRMNIQSIPTLVLLNSRNEEIKRKGGMMASDQILFILYGNKFLPINPDLKDESFCLLSFNPKSIKIGQNIDTIDFNENKMAPVKIKDIRKAKLQNIKEQYGERVVQPYLDMGGRKDWAYIIIFKRIKK